ncbi:MAG: ferritin-like domain-containing protein [Comamonadaceae bacterium]
MTPRESALALLIEPNPEAKVAGLATLWTQAQAFDWPEASRSAVLQRTHAHEAAQVPGRPERPNLVAPGQVPTRSPFTIAGRAALIHAICHIEFNAINLALDAVWRYPDMPTAFYMDWLGVAYEESTHFALLAAHLRDLPNPEGPTWHYGDFTAHDGLWAMCEKTADDITARMALVPRTLEARGLDATPLIQAKLARIDAPDARAAIDILDIILRDEIGHVAIGNKWYHTLCDTHALDPIAHYRLLVDRHDAPQLKPPFNEAARKKAGFTDAELAYLLDLPPRG